MKLAEWARRNSVHPQIAYRWVREGTMPVPIRKLPSGTIMVDIDVHPGRTVKAVVYARVSSADRRADLDRQVARVTEWATVHGMTVTGVVTEVGSALNGKRKKFLALLCDPSRRLWSNTGIGSPASEPNTSKPHCPRTAVGCWLLIRARLTTTWFAT